MLVLLTAVMCASNDDGAYYFGASRGSLERETFHRYDLVLRGLEVV